MASFEIGCPACRARFDCPTDRAGRPVRCGSCANVFDAPSLPVTAIALPAAPPAPRPVLRVAAPVAVALPVARASSPVVARYAPDRPAPRRRRPSGDEELGTSTKVYVLGGVGAVVLLGLFAVAAVALKRGANDPVAPVAAKAESAAQPLSATADAPGPPAPVAAPPPVKVAAELPSGTPAQAIQRVKGSTTYIRTQSRNQVASGSGFFAGPAGYVVTNAHVLGFGPKDVKPPSRVEVVVHSGEGDQKTYNARVVGVSVEDDLALIWVNGTDNAGAPLPAPLAFGRTADLVETQEVVIYGFPLGEKLGLNISVNKTTVSSLRKEKGVVEMVQVADGMTRGNSGGPVANTRGEVIGVVVAGIEGTPINFAIPGDKAAAFLARQLAAGGNFEMGRLAPLWKGRR